MEYILFSGLALVGGQLVRKNNQILGYGLIAISWVALAIDSVIAKNSWWLGGLSLVLGALFILLIANDQKRMRSKRK